MAETKPLLRVRNLRTTFHSHKQLVKAVRGFNIEVAPGEIVAVVGESGSGKSVAMKSIMGLLPPNADIEADVLEYDGRDLLAMKPAARRAMCGGEIAMIFQDPMTALDPLHTVGYHLYEVLRRHRGLKGARPHARRPCACSVRWASPRRSSACPSIPTSSRAACASACSSPWRCAASRA